jgi:hypothetical protein
MRPIGNTETPDCVSHTLLLVDAAAARVSANRVRGKRDDSSVLAVIIL